MNNSRIRNFKIMLKYYTRDKNGNRNGCLIAISDGESFAIGYSKCRKGDKFDKNLGTKIALARAEKILSQQIDAIEIPFSMSEDFDKMSERAVRFFKPKENKNA